MKNLLKISLLLFTTSVFSQNYTGKVEYQTVKNNLNKEKKEGVKIDGMSEEEMKVFEAEMEKAFQKKYELTFNKNEAVFEQVLELDKPKPESGMQLMVKMSGDGVKYMNTKNKTYVEEEELMDEEFLIKDSLQKINWTITNETKKIGDYTCQKATYILPVSKIQNTEYENYLEKVKKGEKVFFEVKKPEPITVVAWFAPEIPVSFGPNGVWGLPGLILQLEDARLLYLCTKVNVKNNEIIKIKVPNTGKVVTKKEFEKFEEMMLKRMNENGGPIIIKKMKE